MALVLDGNMKNHRYVCCATHAGYAEFDGLKGKIRTGCPNTPAFKSPFCSIHTPMVAVQQDISCDNDAVSPEASATQSEKQPVGLITQKKTTRNSTLYKVQSTNYYYYTCS